MFGSDTNSHRRCESIEAMLRARINDLEQRETEMLQRLSDLSTTHANHISELLDRYMASTAPGALRELAAANRSASPAAPMPSLVRTPMTSTPGLHANPGQPGVARTRLTPTATGFGARGSVGGGAVTAAQSIPVASAPSEDVE